MSAVDTIQAVAAALRANARGGARPAVVAVPAPIGDVIVRILNGGLNTTDITAFAHPVFAGQVADWLDTCTRPGAAPSAVAAAHRLARVYLTSTQDAA